MRRFLDTTFVIDYLRGQPEALERFSRLIEDGVDVYVNEIVACETRTGLRDRDVPILDAFLRPIEFVQPGPEIAIRAGSWRAAAHALGRQLSVPDALIASTAVALDAAVITRNVRDFSLTPVRIDTY